MADFPKLTTGAVSQYPSARRSSYSTHVVQFVDGAEQRFRELRSAVRRWLIRLDQVTPREAAEIELFFVSRQGQFASFTFVDPWDGTEYPDCSFDQDQLSVASVADSESKTQLVIRNNRL
jgi:hypothetical protein